MASFPCFSSHPLPHHAASSSNYAPFSKPNKKNQPPNLTFTTSRRQIFVTTKNPSSISHRTLSQSHGTSPTFNEKTQSKAIQYIAITIWNNVSADSRQGNYLKIEKPKLWGVLGHSWMKQPKHAEQRETAVRANWSKKQWNQTELSGQIWDGGAAEFDSLIQFQSLNSIPLEVSVVTFMNRGLWAPASHASSKAIGGAKKKINEKIIK